MLCDLYLRESNSWERPNLARVRYFCFSSNYSEKIAITKYYSLEYECQKEDLFQYEGRCIDRSKIEQTLVRSAAKIYTIDENFVENNGDVRRCTDSKDGNR